MNDENNFFIVNISIQYGDFLDYLSAIIFNFINIVDTSINYLLYYILNTTITVIFKPIKEINIC